MDGFDADDSSFGEEVLDSLVDHLSHSRLFASVPQAMVQQCGGAFAIRRLPSDTTVRLDGGADRTVHVIRWGRVRLELSVPPSEPIVIAKLERDGAFGVQALVDPASRPLRAITLQPTMLYSAPAAMLRPRLDSCAQLWANVAGILSEQFDGAAVGVSGVAHAALCDRVFAALERVAAEHGVTVADGTLLDAALGTEDVAVLAQTSQEAAATALFHLERADRIRTIGTSLTLLRRA